MQPGMKMPLLLLPAPFPLMPQQLLVQRAAACCCALPETTSASGLPSSSSPPDAATAEGAVMSTEILLWLK